MMKTGFPKDFLWGGAMASSVVDWIMGIWRGSPLPGV